MTQEQDDKIKKLRSTLFRKTDIVEIDIVAESLYEKGLIEDKRRLVADSKLFVKFETILKAGPLWKFNPTNLSLFIKDNEFKFDSNLLIDELALNGNLTCKEIDKNLELYELSYTVRLLQINTHFLKDEVISESEYVCIETLAGRISL